MEAIADADQVIQGFSSEILKSCKKMGRRFKVAATIDPHDYIFQFILKLPNNSRPKEAVLDYFSGGANTASQLKTILQEIIPNHKRPSVLEFASGYGRVTRHLIKQLPHAEIVACDIHPKAIDLAKSFGCQAILSATSPEQFYTGRQFDVVYVISFFTHMPASTWGAWLQALANQVAPGGLMIFTTHGQPALPLMGAPPFNEEGFWFTSISEQKDLSLEHYGSTGTSFDYVYRQIKKTSLELVRFQEQGWVYQDLYILKHRGSGS